MFAVSPFRLWQATLPGAVPFVFLLGTLISSPASPEKSADVRLAQYENGSRTPKADLTASLAQILDVSPHALAVPDIDSYVGLMHTLFTLEDRYGLKICECDGEIHLRVDVFQGKDAARLHEMLCAWGEQAAKLKSGEISKEDYDRWRYRYPEFDTTGHWHKVVPSQGLSDLLACHQQCKNDPQRAK